MTPTKAFCATILVAGGLTIPAALMAPAADAATESVVYSFQNNGKDGLLPQANLVDVNGVLYGTTGAGGTGRCLNGCGTIFSVNVATGAENVLRSFGGQDGTGPMPGSLTGAGGALFGTTFQNGRRGEGMLFSIDPETDKFRDRYYFCYLYDCVDGQEPNSGLLDSKGTLYGTTERGGGNASMCADECGTVFSFDPRTNTETVLYSFCNQENCADGAIPAGGLLNMRGTYYGATNSGGVGSYCTEYVACGTVFSFDPVSDAESVIYSFCNQADCDDGGGPQGNLVIFKHVLYGTTYSGGARNSGTVFSIDLATGTESVLYSFKSNADPVGSLVDVNGTLYGVTSRGGAGSSCYEGCGTVYAIDTKTGREKLVYSFCSQTECADGAYPEAGLLNVNGTLYGVTYYGGSGTCDDSEDVQGCGTVFTISP